MSAPGSPLGALPQSSALAEATGATGGESLAELFSRDPEGYSDQDIRAVVEAMRAHRARLAAAEASGQKLPRAKSAEPKTKGSTLAATELDL